jgi:hypothetical protein
MIEKLQDCLPSDAGLFTAAIAAKEMRGLKAKINEVIDVMNEFRTMSKQLLGLLDGLH